MAGRSPPSVWRMASGPTLRLAAWVRPPVKFLTYLLQSVDFTLIKPAYLRFYINMQDGLWGLALGGISFSTIFYRIIALANALLLVSLSSSPLADLTKLNS